MQKEELTPEEKLYNAIFGEPAWTEESHHFLSPEGTEAIHQVLNKIQEKYGERGVKVLRLRFGFEPRTVEENAKRPYPYSNARTLNEVGVYFGVTKERIRQIEARTLRRLRHPAYTRRLKPYLE